MSMNWKTISEETLHDNPWTSFRHRVFETDKGVQGNYYFVQTRGGCSMVIPRLPDGRFVMIREYRYLENIMSIEFPGGGIETEQTPEVAAQVELRQEAGYEAASFVQLGKSSPCMGVVVDPTYFFLATDITSVGTEHEKTESIEVIIVSEDEIDQMIRDGKIINGQTLSAWAMYRAQQLHI